jgi:hypothetical protein
MSHFLESVEEVRREEEREKRLEVKLEEVRVRLFE